MLVGSVNPIPYSIKKPPNLEFKPLPNHLRYAFVEEANILPIITSNELTIEQEKRVYEVVRVRVQEYLGWLNPSIVMHKRYMEEENRPTVERKRQLNPYKKKVLNKEIVKLFDTCIICPILIMSG